MLTSNLSSNLTSPWRSFRGHHGLRGHLNGCYKASHAYLLLPRSMGHCPLVEMSHHLGHSSVGLDSGDHWRAPHYTWEEEPKSCTFSLIHHHAWFHNEWISRTFSTDMFVKLAFLLVSKSIRRMIGSFFYGVCVYNKRKRIILAGKLPMIPISLNSSSFLSGASSSVR